MALELLFICKLGFCLRGGKEAAASASAAVCHSSAPLLTDLSPLLTLTQGEEERRRAGDDYLGTSSQFGGCHGVHALMENFGAWY